MRAPSLFLITAALILSTGCGFAQDAGMGLTSNPATPSDPVIYHHKAYPATKYGVSCPATGLSG